MKTQHGLKAVLAAFLGAAAILALPAAANAREHGHDRVTDRLQKRHHLMLKGGDHLGSGAGPSAGDNHRAAGGGDSSAGEEGAGKISSFDASTGKLVIALPGGETVTGLVTEETEINCEGASASSSDESGEEGDGHSGSGNDDSQGEEAHGGDDQGDDDGGEEASCTVASLVPGAVVQQAELELEHGVAVFGEVDLAG